MIKETFGEDWLKSLRFKSFRIVNLSSEFMQWAELYKEEAKQMIIDHFGETNVSEIELTFHPSVVEGQATSWDLDVNVYYEKGGNV